MHSYVWEQGCVAQDNTIHLAALAWLANSMDLSEHSIPDFHLLLEELNHIPEDKLREWPAYHHNVPWSHIFKLVVAPSSQTEALNLAFHREKIIPTLAQLLQKMSLHPPLFESMIHDLDHALLVGFMQRLALEPPSDKVAAYNRLESITSLLSSKRWAGMNAQEQPVMHTFKILLNCLSMLQTTHDAQDISTSWIFTLCHVEETKPHTRSTRSWPNPELIRLTPDAFRNQDLREHAMRHFLQFIDAILSGTEPVIDTIRQWRWNRDGEATTEDQLIVMKLLVTHILPIFLTFDDTQGRPRSQDFLNQLLSGDDISSPTLRLVIAAFGGHQNLITLPLESDAIWHDQVWEYAIAAWYGFHSDDMSPGGREISESVLVGQSTSMIGRLRGANSVAFDALIKLSTESHYSSMVRFALILIDQYLFTFFISSIKFWIGLFRSIQWGDTETIQKISSQTVKLYLPLNTFID
jgi:hypothetical protein